jgi:phospholipid-binding lipoprotein MlaA
MKIPKFRKQPSRWLVLGLTLMAQVAIAQVEEDFLSEEDFYGDFGEETVFTVSDPLEPINRAMFKFNDFLYVKIMQPVSNGYQKVTPDSVEEGASNFFVNLGYPVRLVGNLLQLQFKGAWLETERFAVNTTIGVVGVRNAADQFESLQPMPPEDVGLAFGAWGIGEGPYLVLPLFGPSNCRDLVGFIGDSAVNPLKSPYSVIEEYYWQYALDATETVVKSPKLLGLYGQMKEGAIDPYSSIKNGYTQKRRSMVESD